jgi:3-hydroxybutyryl-CoA dehydrogenase
MAIETERPDRVCGVHFFNPAPMMSLVEIVPHAGQRDETIAETRAFAEACGKEPSRWRPGRLHRQRPAVPLPQQRGAHARGRARPRGRHRHRHEGRLQLPDGALALLDLVGLDTSVAILDALYEEFRDPNYAHVPRLRRMVAAVTSVVKAGKGFTTTKGDMTQLGWTRRAFLARSGATAGILALGAVGCSSDDDDKAADEDKEGRQRFT